MIKKLDLCVCGCGVKGLESSVYSTPHESNAYGVEITIYCPMCTIMTRCHLGYDKAEQVKAIMEKPEATILHLIPLHQRASGKAS